jgi:protein-disulfide isomerase
VTTKKATKKAGNRSFITLVAIALIAGVAIIGYLLNRPKPAPIVVADNTPLPPAQGYVMGADSAPVEIVEFADFECPGCGRFALLTEPEIRTRLVATGRARFRFVDFPLEMHRHARFAHNAAACANAQGKFWEYHDKLFAEQTRWNGLATRNPLRLMKGYARELGLNTDAFNTCLDANQFDPQIRANSAEGVKRGVGGTPTVFVGNRLLPGIPAYDMIKALVDTVTAEAKGGRIRTFGDTGKQQ